MKTNLSIGIDLGRDTIKIAFAYKTGKDIKYGKFDGKAVLTQIALPAIAYYNYADNQWLFCDQVGKGSSTSFVTVVKIKNLISLLSAVNNPSRTRVENKRITESNSNFYYKKDHFPKFFFPERRRMKENFAEMVDASNTFRAKGHTPQSVCEQFFSHIEKIISVRIQELEIQTGLTFEDYKIALVHPMSVGEEYLAGLSDLLYKVFKKDPHKILNSNKALAIFAEHRKAIQKGDNFLVFDMAEEDISVTRIGITETAIIIDGKDGHNDPLKLGGVDVDEAIVNDLENSIAERETIGTPSAGENGHIAESGVYGKQYLLMKDIKKAKVIFSKPTLQEKFKKGVPVTLSWDLCIQRMLTKEDVKKSIGVKTNSGIAKNILDYILKELNRPLNHNIQKIFISGGLTETYSLLDYLKTKLKLAKPKIEVLTFDDGLNADDGFSIRSFEDSVFAPAVGGAIASLTNKTIKVVLSLSYATWANPKGKNIKVLQIFANRGECVDGGKDFVIKLTLRRKGVLSGEELFSTFVTTSDIAKKKPNGNYVDGDLVVGNENSLDRKKARQNIDIKTVSGGDKGFLIPTYNGTKIEIAPSYFVDFIEGMRVDKDGRAHPIIKNVSAPTKLIKIISGGTTKTIYAKDVVIVNNLTEFDTSQG